MTPQQDAVMIVDDEKDILSVITHSLESKGIKVHAFDSPISALEHIKAGCKDCWLLLSDVKMPSISGFELVRRAKELSPGMVVVLMTAFEINKAEFEKVLPSTRVDGFIQKPAKPSELINTIKRFESIRQRA